MKSNKKCGSTVYRDPVFMWLPRYPLLVFKAQMKHKFTSNNLPTAELSLLCLSVQDSVASTILSRVATKI